MIKVRYHCWGSLGVAILFQDCPKGLEYLVVDIRLGSEEYPSSVLPCVTESVAQLPWSRLILNISWQ